MKETHCNVLRQNGPPECICCFVCFISRRSLSLSVGHKCVFVYYWIGRTLTPRYIPLLHNSIAAVKFNKPLIIQSKSIFACLCFVVGFMLSLYSCLSFLSAAAAFVLKCYCLEMFFFLVVYSFFRLLFVLGAWFCTFFFYLCVRVFF